MKRSLLLIYTGGTIGMKQDPDDFTLKPFNFKQILKEVPELKKFGYSIDTISFNPLIDSSDAQPEFWLDIAEIIKNNYVEYDGFVVLHGTDTMSYTASALSFMLENLAKPVVFTGSQLPIGMLRTDGKENLISSIEIAAAVNSEGRPMVPEVCIYFDNQLYRGNRTTKYNAENFRAFRSANYSILAETGIHIKYKEDAIIYPKRRDMQLKVHTNLDTNVAILKIYPGIEKSVVDAVIDIEGLRAIVLETYGSGNAPTREWFLNCIKRAYNKGLILLNVSQCMAGSVNMDAYATGIALKKIGVISAYDSTTEAAMTKLFFLLGQHKENEKVKVLLRKNLRGEISL
jgi:L-asparaginase